MLRAALIVMLLVPQRICPPGMTLYTDPTNANRWSCVVDEAARVFIYQNACPSGFQLTSGVSSQLATLLGNVKLCSPLPAATPTPVP